MAERRMFAKTIIDSDAFLDMPCSTQCLYFHLSMRADDDGFVNSPKKIQRVIGANDDDLKLLVAKRFIIPFDSGVVVIKHWKIHNYIQSDRYKPTVYQEEKGRLNVKANKSYSLIGPGEQAPQKPMYPECIHDVSRMETQVRLGKDRLEVEEELDKSIPESGKIEGSGEEGESPDLLELGLYENVLLTPSDLEKLKGAFSGVDAAINRLSTSIFSGKTPKGVSHYNLLKEYLTICCMKGGTQ